MTWHPDMALLVYSRIYVDPGAPVVPSEKVFEVNRGSLRCPGLAS